MTIAVAVGTKKGLWLARSRAAGEWSVQGPRLAMREVPALAFLPSPASEVPRLLAGVRSEHWGPTVANSPDLGETWEETEQAAIRFPAEDRAALERIWQIQPDPARPDVVWAGCEPTSLWRSTDAGRSFTLVRGLWDHPHRERWQPGAGGAAVHTVVTDPADPDRVLVAMSTGGVYATEDGGDTWQPRNAGISAGFLPDPEPVFGQCVHKVAADAIGPQRLYAQNHGGVYRSDDAAMHWVSIAAGLPADFGFTVLADPDRPGTACVIPLVSDGYRMPPDGRLRVHRTEDGGESWKEVGAGLPDRFWNAVLRDAACVLSPAPGQPSFLVLGTRDGCVYASADEGDSMVQVAAHLPDVLCVRAAVLP
ncbi:MAG TPA: exo-alpha-sialidase [Mycobacteriales bacterium]|nr:exo-alpha-sialidase [Mycobacteriales bacterium]